MNIEEQLSSITQSPQAIGAELMLCAGLLLVIIAGLFKMERLALTTASMAVLLSAVFGIFSVDLSVSAFAGLLRKVPFTSALSLLLDLAALLTFVLVASRNSLRGYRPEFFALVLTILIGGHILLMSESLLMVFLSIELISIPSYALAAWCFDQKGSEASLKFFLFGAVSSAVMLYGFSLLYGMSGTLEFTSENFVQRLLRQDHPAVLLAAGLAVAGLLFKVAAAPMHVWAPDVYEGAPYPAVALLSTVPKLAGLGALAKFVFAVNLHGASRYDWQLIISVVALVTILAGNLAALAQQHPRRMMAYSSIAQSGFMMCGIAAFTPQGLHTMLFYAAIYILMNFSVFGFLSFFERQGIVMVGDFTGRGKEYATPLVLLLVAFVALTGIPPTAGFTAKLFVFSGIWESFERYDKPVLLWLLVVGLLNTVISLFYYLKIPYYAFLKSGKDGTRVNIFTIENLLAGILVLMVIALFFAPGLLMGWINKVNFVF